MKELYFENDSIYSDFIWLRKRKTDNKFYSSKILYNIGILIAF